MLLILGLFISKGGFSTFLLGSSEIVFLASFNSLELFFLYLFFSFLGLIDFLTGISSFSSFNPKTSSTILHLGIILPIFSAKAISSIYGSESEPDSSFNEYFYLFFDRRAATSAIALGRFYSA